MFSSEFQLDLSEKTSKNVLDYIFSKEENENLKTAPVWIDAELPTHNLSQERCFALLKRLGLWLSQSIVRPGDIVLVVSPNHIMFPVAYLGIVASGAAFSGSNPNSTVDELSHQLRDTESKAVLVHPACVPNVLAAAKRVGLPADKLFLLHDGDESVQVSGIWDWRRKAPAENVAEHWKWKSLDSRTARATVATVNYSSGTTGLPKGVRISHANLIANMEQNMFMRNLGETLKCQQHRWIGFLPFYHAFGQMYFLLVSAKTCVPVYIMKRFEFKSFLRTVEEYKITQLHTAPPVLVMLNHRPETQHHDLSSLKEVFCGAAPLSSSLQNSLHEKLGLNIKQGWGMTELVCGGMHVPAEVLHDNSGSVGKLDPNCEAKLLDEDGKELSVNTPGELFIRGPNVCLGYHKNQEATYDAIDKDGWLRTGDVAVCNERGWWHIVDRRKELIKVKGFQVAPAELEAVLLENSTVADAAVVAFEDLNGQEVPRAYVKMVPEGNEDARAIEDWVASRVSSHKHLIGGVAFVDEIPKLPSGKILRRVVREWSKRDSKSIHAKL